MEKFKACEKEMKTKAFSKDGLIAALKLDPKEKEKAETSAWLAAQVDELSRQIEQSEAEVESLQGGPKKRAKGTASSRLEELETLNDRRKWHISRLEIVLRLLENGALPTEKVLELKEDISYFVESNTVGITAAPLFHALTRIPYRRKTLKRTRVYMTTSTLMQRKLHLALWETKVLKTRTQNKMV
jgi:Not1 N-terminal domain, CCR4-Not complex component